MSRPRHAASDAAPSGWAFRVRGEVASDELEVDIFDAIGDDFWTGGGCTAKSVRALLRDSKARTIRVRLNSAGGDVVDGLAIYGLLSESKARVVVHVDALAASIASIVAMAGDEIILAESAFMMIHNPTSWICGDASDMRERAELLDKMRENLVSVYAARTGQPREAIVAAMDAETWMTAAEAKALGYATEVVPLKALKAPKPAEAPTKAAARARADVATAAIWNLASFAKVPAKVLAAQAAAKLRAATPGGVRIMATAAEIAEACAACAEACTACAEAATGGTADEFMAAVAPCVAACQACMDACNTMGAPAPAEGEPAPDGEPMPAAEPAAAARQAMRLTGKATVSEAMAELERRSAVAVSLEAREAKLAADQRTLEAEERRSLVVALVRGGEKPATAWASGADGLPDGKTPAEPWASMRIDLLRARAATLTAPAGTPKPPTGAAALDLTPAERAMCKAKKLDPATYAATRDAIKARSSARPAQGV